MNNSKHNQNIYGSISAAPFQLKLGRAVLFDMGTYVYSLVLKLLAIQASGSSDRNGRPGGVEEQRLLSKDFLRAAPVLQEAALAATATSVISAAFMQSVY